MKYAIKFTTYDTTKTAEESISIALGFSKTLSHEALIWFFSNTAKNGKFSSKKNAKFVADKINKRGAFGGFGNFKIIAEVI